MKSASRVAWAVAFLFVSAILYELRTMPTLVHSPASFDLALPTNAAGFGGEGGAGRGGSVLRAQHTPPCPPRLNVVFIALAPTWGSAIMRGNMTVDKLRDTGHAAHLVRTKAFLAETEAVVAGKVEDVADPDLAGLPFICVCVKFCDAKVIAACRARNAAILWDMLDVQPELLSPDIVRTVDTVVANSERHATILASPKHAARSVRLVYHHHSNSFGIAAPPHWPPAQAPARLCFTAAATNALHARDEQAIRDAAEAAGFAFVKVPIGGAAVPPSEDDPYEQRSVLLPLVDGCDAAIIWPRNSTDDFTLNYRPVTRLITWWSVNIPTVVYPYAAYVDMMDMLPPGIPRMYASTFQELRAVLAWLATGKVSPLTRAWPAWPAGVQDLKVAQAAVAADFDLDGRMPSYTDALCTAWAEKVGRDGGGQ